MSKSAATVTNKPKCPVSYAFPVLLSCFLMAANAGFVNAIFLESLYGTSVSHLTGMTTRAASQFAIGSYELMLRNLGVIFFYFLGSAVNSFIVGDSQMRMVQNYGFAVMLESALLLVPIFVPTNSRLMINISVYFVAAACGLQNGFFIFLKIFFLFFLFSFFFFFFFLIFNSFFFLISFLRLECQFIFSFKNVFHSFLIN